MRNQRIVIQLTLTLFILLGFSGIAEAANRFWIAGSGNWSQRSHWSTSSGGSGNASLPDSGDRAIFDSNSGGGTCTINQTVDIRGLDMRTGNTTTISQGTYAVTIGNQNAVFTAGTFTGGSANIDINGTFTLSGASFTSTSANLYIGDTFTISSGTFTHNSGTVVFDTNNFTITPGSATFNNITFNAARTFTIASGTTLTVNGTLNLTNGTVRTGTISAKGNVVVGASADGDSATLSLTGTGDQTITGNSGGVFQDTLNINKSSGTATITGTCSGIQAITVSLGTLDFDGGYTYTIDDADSITVSSGATLNLTGSKASLVTLRSDRTGRQWDLNVNTAANYRAEYVDVRDSNASGGKKIVAYASVNSGNNTNWSFPDKLVLIPTEGQTLIQDQTSSSIAIEIQYAGAVVTVPGNVNIILTSTSSGGRFSTDGATWSDSNTLTVTITAGTSSVSFYYKDSIVGTPTITASEDPSLGLEDATQIHTIKTKTNTFLVSASSPQVAGSNFTLTITAKDAVGNTDTSFSFTVNLTVNYVSPSSGSGTLSVTSTSNFINGVATITDQTFSDCGTITITATYADDSTKTGTSNNIVFIPYDFTVVPGDTTQTVNRAFNLVVTARNAQGTTCPNYKGTANLTAVYVLPSSDQAGTISPSSLGSTYFTNGIAQLTTTKYNKWGTIKIKATDSLRSASTDQSQEIRFNPKDFSITLSTPPKSRSFYYKDEQFTATVTARDQDNNTITNYQGNIELSSSDRTLSSPYTFLPADSGTHKFQISFSIPGKITLSAKDANYTNVTGQSAEFEVKEAKIQVFSTAGPVGNVAVTVKILDAQDKVISDDDSTTFTVTLKESTANNTATSDATTIAVTFKGGLATIYVKDQEAETVTITPSSSPVLTPVSGTVTFGSFQSRGIGIDMWREIK